MDSNTTDTKQALVDKVKDSTNILVTVSANPTVDQLAACLGLTLWLNKIEKHATAVFSGEVPSTIEFLQPESTLEKNTDSLRDFIIALDKSKADKLRYKVEDKVVKIFITPYRTSLSDADLEFSQGDFNVDMVIALGVHAQQDLDTAITAHGRILHDATVATITTGEQASELGSIGWHEAAASSLSELVVDLGNAISQEQLDGQIATALLTGIVAETARFSNEKTTPQTMSISAQLMSAGANQQLVASKLEEPEPPKPEVPAAEEKPADKPNDGTLEIDHPAEEKTEEAAPVEEEPKADFTLPAVDDGAGDSPAVTDVKTTSSDLNTVDQPALAESDDDQGSHYVAEPPAMGGTLTANSQPEDTMLEPSSDPLSQEQPADKTDRPLLDRDSAPASLAPDSPAPADSLQPAPPSWMPQQSWMSQPAGAATPEPESDKVTSDHDQTLAEIEREVDSPHLKPDAPAETSDVPAEPTSDTTPPDLSAARDEVMKAIDSTPEATPEPIQALNAQPVDLEPPQASADTPVAPSLPPNDAPAEPSLPPNDAPAEQPAAPAGPQPYVPSTAFDPTAFQIANDPDPEVAAATQPAAATPADPDLTGPVDQPFTLPVPSGLTPPPANPVPPTSTPGQPAPPPVPPPMTRF